MESSLKSEPCCLVFCWSAVCAWRRLESSGDEEDPAIDLEGLHRKRLRMLLDARSTYGHFVIDFVWSISGLPRFVTSRRQYIELQPKWA
jgi:hypothetical protein